MFGIVIVPRYSIVMKEGKELFLILFKSLLQFVGDFAPKTALVQKTEETIHVFQMLPQEVCFQPAAIDSIHNGSQQRSKLKGHRLCFLVKWVVQNVIVQIPHQMYKTFLLR